MRGRKLIRYFHFLILIAMLIIASTINADARKMRTWSYQQLFDQSDLVAIGTPTATQDTPELIGRAAFYGHPVRGDATKVMFSGVETKFADLRCP